MTSWWRAARHRSSTESPPYFGIPTTRTSPASPQSTIAARTFYRRVAATPRLPRGYSVETSNAADGTRQFGRDRPRLRYLRKRDMLAASLQKAGFWIGPLPKGSYYLFVGFASVPALRGLGPTEAAILCGDQHLEGNAKVRVPRRRRCG